MRLRPPRRFVRNSTRVAPAFPEGLRYDMPFDSTVFVTASIHEIYQTLIEAGVLVLMVILLFLQNWRATMVPATTVPVVVIGAFAVDGAARIQHQFLDLVRVGIVYWHRGGRCHRRRRRGFARDEHRQNAKQAAIDAMSELMGPIIGITLVLTAVFIPAAFISGISGQMYRQFALVIAATAVLSAVNAITQKPAQSAQYLRPRATGRQPGALSRRFNAFFTAAEAAYARVIRAMIDRRGITAVAALLLMGAAAIGLWLIPTDFLPVEDQGYLVVALELPDAASFERTQRVLKRVVDL